MRSNGGEKKKIVRRLRRLRNVEFLNIFLFPAIIAYIYYAATGEVSVLLSAALLVCSLILAEGTYYWHLKLCSLTGKSGFPEHFARTFKTFRAFNLSAMIVLALAICIAVVSGRAGLGEAIAAIAAGAFAFLEHVNYFRYQLMHDTANDWTYLLRNRRLRRSPLSDDLAAASTRKPND